MPTALNVFWKAPESFTVQWWWWEPAATMSTMQQRQLLTSQSHQWTYTCLHTRQPLVLITVRFHSPSPVNCSDHFDTNPHSLQSQSVNYLKVAANVFSHYTETWFVFVTYFNHSHPQLSTKLSRADGEVPPCCSESFEVWEYGNHSIAPATDVISQRQMPVSVIL